jgi:hypothetical protein
MRLREFASEVNRDEAAALMTVLQHFAANKGPAADISFKEISSAMNQAGFNFNYEMFTNLVTDAPSINNMISTYDQNRIKLGPKQPDANSPEAGKNMVDRMASKAAGSALK